MLAEIEVTGAVDGGQARAIAARIATSPLVKTALFGHDANWGRVLAAAGSAPHNGGFAVRRRRAASRLSYNGTLVLDRGAPAGRRAGRLERHLPDRARPRARRGRGQLPDERPLLRLRPHQRGLPDMSLIVVKLGGAVAGECGDASCSAWRAEHEVCVVHGAGPQISAEMERAGLEVTFVERPARHDRRGARRRPRFARRRQRGHLRRDRPARGAALRRRDRAPGDAGAGARPRRRRRFRRGPPRVADALAAGLIPVDRAARQPAR